MYGGISVGSANAVSYTHIESCFDTCLHTTHIRTCRQYPWFVENASREEGHVRNLGLLVPAPDAPNDPRCVFSCVCNVWLCA